MSSPFCTWRYIKEKAHRRFLLWLPFFTSARCPPYQGVVGTSNSLHPYCCTTMEHGQTPSRPLDLARSRYPSKGEQKKPNIQFHWNWDQLRHFPHFSPWVHDIWPDTNMPSVTNTGGGPCTGKCLHEEFWPMWCAYDIIVVPQGHPRTCLCGALFTGRLRSSDGFPYHHSHWIHGELTTVLSHHI